jgi:hypothetical protein
VSNQRSVKASAPDDVATDCACRQPRGRHQAARESSGGHRLLAGCLARLRALRSANVRPPEPRETGRNVARDPPGFRGSCPCLLGFAVTIPGTNTSNQTTAPCPKTVVRSPSRAAGLTVGMTPR